MSSTAAAAAAAAGEEVSPGENPNTAAMPLVCPNCGSRDILNQVVDWNEGASGAAAAGTTPPATAGGSSVCTACGVVVVDDAANQGLVPALEFVDSHSSSHNKSAVAGHFVPHKAYAGRTQKQAPTAAGQTPGQKGDATKTTGTGAVTTSGTPTTATGRSARTPGAGSAATRSHHRPSHRSGASLYHSHHHHGGGHSSYQYYGFSRDSRETTLANGRRRIQDVAARLRLSNLYVDAAHRLFTLAVEKNFVQGRRTTHVVAACLYIACRQEKSQHMLIDFSDALQVNVYTLGTCFLKFRRLLGLRLEMIDPALYVYRFAAHLELNKPITTRGGKDKSQESRSSTTPPSAASSNKANAVALTALRLVGRMKRDWIVAGRRPAGICAAALLIAARAHGYDQHVQDVTRILRVCGLTVTQRVKEFEQTVSAQLTLEQFNNQASTSSGSAAQQHQQQQQQALLEADPPVYTRNKIREARAEAILKGNVELLTSGALDDPMPPSASDDVSIDSSSNNDTSQSKNNRKDQGTINSSSQKKRARQWRESITPAETTQPEPSTTALTIAGTPNKQMEKKQKFAQLYSSLTEELTTQQQSADDKHVSFSPTTTTGTRSLRKRTRRTSDSAAASQQEDGQELALPEGSDEKSMGSSSLQVIRQAAAQGLEAAYPRTKYGKVLVLPHQATDEERQASSAPVEAKLNLNEWKQGITADLEDEFDNMFRTDEEVAQKEAIFNKINKDYLEQQERKESERLSAEAATKTQEKEDTAQAEGHARYYKTAAAARQHKRRRRESSGSAAATPMTAGPANKTSQVYSPDTAAAATAGAAAAASAAAAAAAATPAAQGAAVTDAMLLEQVPPPPPAQPTTEEQLLAAVSSRKISRKINYDALSSIFDEDGSFSTDVVDDIGAVAADHEEGEESGTLYDMI